MQKAWDKIENGSLPQSHTLLPLQIWSWSPAKQHPPASPKIQCCGGLFPVPVSHTRWGTPPSSWASTEIFIIPGIKAKLQSHLPFRNPGTLTARTMLEADATLACKHPWAFAALPQHLPTMLTRITIQIALFLPEGTPESVLEEQHWWWTPSCRSLTASLPRFKYTPRSRSVSGACYFKIFASNQHHHDADEDLAFLSFRTDC